MAYNFGAYTTMITPYKENGEVDYDTARAYVRYYAENGLDGIFAVCQSSEIFYLTLEERMKLNACVYDEVQKIYKETGKLMTVVSSGHVSDTIDKQAIELSKIAETGTDALILITNRLDPYNRGDDTFIKNAEALLKLIPENVALGFYECPYPYKRLVTPKILDWCLSTGRFYFMKDTCCDISVIKQRIRQLRGSKFALYNANCQTLLESLIAGGAGYCGIMANFHPKLYSWLCNNFDRYPEEAELVQAALGTFGFTEVGLPYPLTAKYSMTLSGIATPNVARNRKSEELTYYARDCVRQMKLFTDKMEEDLRKAGL
jgi:4-hydroxy-tetrahydrodipicolinate synthase